MDRNRHHDPADRYAASRERDRSRNDFGREIYTGGMGRGRFVEDTPRDREQRNTGAYPAEARNRELENHSFFDDAIRPDYRGRGPRSSKSNDDRINDAVVHVLTEASEVDATNIDVRVENGDVTLRGTVTDRRQKRLASDLAEWCFGVRNVFNQLRVVRSDDATQFPAVSNE